MVVNSLKRPNDGQRRVTLRSCWTLSLHVTWGNVVAGRRAKTPKVKGGTPSPATRDQPL
ncbi:hypothetical protein SOW02_05410 [Pectobacterium actinidiae]|uniref:hypothetical protein n=1 Tax=Pectobacterium actinidiae TaxID=1507808 RepID=UPI002A827431|nr:hypothetical protein [Pectobacterium actinidiae]MDY4314378.1 hypothetical protein [Pectobacterium actinidiae]